MIVICGVIFRVLRYLSKQIVAKSVLDLFMNYLLTLFGLENREYGRRDSSR
jgi:hypothetical protein